MNILHAFLLAKKVRAVFKLLGQKQAELALLAVLFFGAHVIVNIPTFGLPIVGGLHLIIFTMIRYAP